MNPKLLYCIALAVAFEQVKTLGPSVAATVTFFTGTLAITGGVVRHVAWGHLPVDAAGPDRDRFATSAWRMMLHGACMVIGVCGAAPLRIADAASPTAAAGALTKTYVLIQLAAAYETAAAYSFRKFERRDHLLMMAHHLITIVLLLNTIWAGLWSFAAYVLVLHDITDAALEAAKVRNYYLGGAKDTLTQAFFVGNAAFLWPVARLCLFPQALHAMWTGNPAARELPIMFTLMSALVLMHAWWWAMMLRVMLRLSSGETPGAAAAAEYENAA